MKVLTLSAIKAATGTSFKGYVDTSYDKLVVLFGEPYSPVDNYKVDVQWIVRTPHGYATIYNYKNGPAYLGKSGMQLEEIRQWHVGSKNDEAFTWVHGYIETTP